MSDKENPEQHERLLQMITGFWISKSVGVMAQLQIADKLVNGGKTCEELANETEAHPRALYRLMRTLSSFGLFREDEQKRFNLTPMSEYLVRNRKGSLYGLAMHAATDSYKAWSEVLHSAKTEEPAWDVAFGQSVFEYLSTHPESGQIFDEAMTGVSQSWDQAVVEGYDFSNVNSIVDIAGGYGNLVKSILTANPHIEGTVFDIPPVINVASTKNDELSKRVKWIAGDFFKSIHEGADLYILKTILHDWNDSRALEILKNCRKAIPAAGKLLLIETIVPPGNEPSFAKLLDLYMLVIGGRERTEDEYKSLLTETGFELIQILPLKSPQQIIEAQPLP